MKKMLFCLLIAFLLIGCEEYPFKENTLVLENRDIYILFMNHNSPIVYAGGKIGNRSYQVWSSYPEPEWKEAYIVQNVNPEVELIELSRVEVFNLIFTNSHTISVNHKGKKINIVWHITVNEKGFLDTENF